MKFIILSGFIFLGTFGCSKQGGDSSPISSVVSGSLQYGEEAFIAVVGTPVTFSPASKDESVSNCIVTGDEPLPSGLQLNQETCAVSGTPLLETEEITISIQYSSGSGNKTASLKVIVNFCPANYVHVPNGESSFCIAKYEMRNEDGVAVSKPESTPWVSISQNQAKTECDELGEKYGLITNEQWIVTAHNIELQDQNWTSGTAYQGKLISGHSDNSPTATLCDSLIENVGPSSCSALDDASPTQKRIFTLSTGETIWDFGGNAQEWVDYYVTPADKASPSTAWQEFSAITPNEVMTEDVWLPNDLDINHTTSNIGRYLAGPATSGGAARRGGTSYVPDSAGIYTLDLTQTASTPFSGNTGFRCVYNPN